MPTDPDPDPASSRPASAAQGAAMAPAASLPALPGVDAALAVRRLGGNVALYRQVLLVFARSHAHSVEDIAQALAAGQRDAAVRLTHTMRGAIATLGATALALSFHALETAIEVGDAACATRLLADLGAAVASLVEAIDASI